MDSGEQPAVLSRPPSTSLLIARALGSKPPAGEEIPIDTLILRRAFRGAPLLGPQKRRKMIAIVAKAWVVLEPLV